jgi:hypothetical protein
MERDLPELVTLAFDPGLVAGDRSVPPDQDHQCQARRTQPCHQARSPPSVRLPQPRQPTTAITLRNHKSEPEPGHPRLNSKTPHTDAFSMFRVESKCVFMVSTKTLLILLCVISGHQDSEDFPASRVRDEAVCSGGSCCSCVRHGSVPLRYNWILSRVRCGLAVFEGHSKTLRAASSG